MSQFLNFHDDLLLALHLIFIHLVKAIDFTTASFKDFENIPGQDIYATAREFAEYLNFLKENGHLNYRIESLSPVGPEMNLMLPGDNHPTWCVCLVSNDYLGFSQHPLVKARSYQRRGIQQFGAGSGASPAIGGHFVYHQQQLEKKDRLSSIGKTEAILYTTGYTANSATLQCLLHRDDRDSGCQYRNDMAILDMNVHASVYEGVLTTSSQNFSAQ
jgi:glycine C-acetyltransferase